MSSFRLLIPRTKPTYSDVKMYLHVTDKTIKLWKVSERDKRPEGYNLKDEEGRIKDISTITSLQVRTPTQTRTHTQAREHIHYIYL